MENDPHGNLDSWPNGIAQLTKKGEEQVTKIGEYLRENYLSHLSIKNTSQIEIRTGEVERVVRSAEFVYQAFVNNSGIEKISQFMPLRMDGVSFSL